MPFSYPTFRPHPLIRGGHLQTIAGTYLPSRTELTPVQVRVLLPDGDTIVLHDDGPPPLAGAKPGPGHSEQPDNPIALLVHGLGGSHQSGYMRRASQKLRARGIHVFRMDLRGCGAGLALARHPVNAGRSEDLSVVLTHLIQHYPDSPIHLVGFSMGANIVLKLVGELASTAPQNLASVLAVSPPMDLAECSRNMQSAHGVLYDRVFVRGLITHLKQRSALVPDAHTLPLEPWPRRLAEFDDVFTAPLCGYAGVHDYYARASSAPLLGRISVPTLIIAATSDPIVPVRIFERGTYSDTTQVVIAPCGGHLGFIAKRGADADLRWMDWRIVEWVTSQAAPASALPVSHHTEYRSMNGDAARVVRGIERSGDKIH